MIQTKLFMAILFVILSVGTNLPSIYAQGNPNIVTFDNTPAYSQRVDRPEDTNMSNSDSSPLKIPKVQPLPEIKAPEVQAKIPKVLPLSTTGDVKGRLIGRDTHKPLARAFIVLCEVTSAYGCTLQANLTATTDAEGWFTIKDVPVGRYTVAYSKAEKKADVSLENEFTIAVPLKIIKGSIYHKKLGLHFEFREKHILDFEVKGGETNQVEITAWGL